MNDKEWNDDKQKEFDKIIYHCFMAGYMSAAGIDTEDEDQLNDYQNYELKEGRLMAETYVAMQKGITDDDIIKKFRKEKKC